MSIRSFLLTNGFKHLSRNGLYGKGSYRVENFGDGTIQAFKCFKKPSWKLKNDKLKKVFVEDTEGLFEYSIGKGNNLNLTPEQINDLRVAIKVHFV